MTWYDVMYYVCMCRCVLILTHRVVNDMWSYFLLVSGNNYLSTCMCFLSCFPQTPTRNRRTVNLRRLMIIPEGRTDVSGSGPNQVNTLCVRGSSPNPSYLEFQCNGCVHVSLPDWDLHVHKCLSNKMVLTHCDESKALKTWLLIPSESHTKLHLSSQYFITWCSDA